MGFETFPFPEGLTPDRPAVEYASDPPAIALAEAALRLNELREAWLNPPDLVERVPEVVRGFPDRVVPVSPKAAVILKKRTLSNLHNGPPGSTTRTASSMPPSPRPAAGVPISARGCAGTAARGQPQARHRGPVTGRWRPTGGAV